MQTGKAAIASIVLLRALRKLDTLACGHLKRAYQYDSLVAFVWLRWDRLVHYLC
jgi:hypothetical protein